MVRISEMMHRQGEPNATFICLSDLRTIWHRSRLYRDIIDGNLTDVQIEHIRRDMLPFVSFLVWIGVEDWFDQFVSIVFKDGQTPVMRPSLPMEKKALLAMGLPEPELTRWHEQYSFIPATLRFHDSEEVQTIEDKLLRLPFMERDANALHGGYGKVEV